MKKEVIFVDDEEDLLELYYDLFQEESFSVKIFSDPTKALTYINENSPNLLFIDFRMPKLNGIELRDKINKDITSYLITGELDLKDTDKFVAVLKKPLSTAIIEELIEKHL